MGTTQINIRDVNPLEHLTSDLAKARFNYESILNGLVEWNSSRLRNVTVRLMCDSDPGFVDYTFPTKAGSENAGVNSADPESTDGTFSYSNRYEISAMVSDDPSMSDRVDIRATVAEGAGSQWRLFASATLYDEATTTAASDYVKGQFMRIPVGASGIYRTLWVTNAIAAGGTVDSGNTDKVFTRWTASDMPRYVTDNAAEYVHVVFNRKVYRPTGTITRQSPANRDSGWEYLCDEFYQADGENFSLKHGKMYLYTPDGNYDHAELFIYTGSDTLYGYPPYELGEYGRVVNDGWTAIPVIMVPVTSGFTRTGSYRWTVTTDINAVVLFRVEDGDLSRTPDVCVHPSIRISGGTTEENGGLRVFDTSNYAAWPGTTPKWAAGSNYSTDVSIGVTGTQNYTATMIFDHADPNCKQCNIVNYDGPDLDQGLAIYLPVESTLDGRVVYPKDGRTFEFLFRIWPNPAYNGHSTADLIINKAQIYVYSVPDRGNVECHGSPIAKFSMARLTTFYVFSENIAVPNRPVLYKAKFVYSADDREWKTYGYYQIPDCVFLSPGGFVDPSMRPNDTYGVETSGFPLVQDPFSRYDMSPVLVDDEYRNRIG